MRYKLLILLAILFWLLALAQNARSQSGQTLNEVVVKETYQAAFSEEKLPVNLKVDFGDIIEIPERLNWSSIVWQERPASQVDDGLRLRLPAFDLAGIPPGPAKRFQVNFSNLSRWKLDIHADDGSVFRSITGEGNPPNNIEWDGRSDLGQPLKPGHSYSYVFTAIDKAGNRRTFPGEIFSVPALYITVEDSLWMGIAESLLFSSHGSGLSRQADAFAREMAGLIHYYAAKRYLVIECDHPRSASFLRLMAGYAGIEISTIRRQTASTPPEEGFVLRTY